MQKYKTAVVTGGAKGIGKGIALAFAKEKYNIVVTDIDRKAAEKTAREIRKLKVSAIAVKCDVSKKRDVKKLFSQTMKKFRRLDVLVNNAGIFPFVSFEKMKESDWDRVLDVNLKSVFLCSQEAASIMKAGGRIISTSSIASFVGFEGLVHYCASKGGMNAMIRALALELASKKITVNAVAPGAIETPGATKVMDDETKKQTVAAIPLARMGKPEDIANAAVFLASPKSSYITGQVIIVDGGWTLR